MYGFISCQNLGQSPQGSDLGPFWPSCPRSSDFFEAGEWSIDLIKRLDPLYYSLFVLCKTALRNRRHSVSVSCFYNYATAIFS